MRPFIVSLAVDPSKLSPRELRTLILLAKGYTCREVAEEMVPPISVKTVDTHRSHLLKKLGLRNNSDLTRYAIRHRLIDVDGREIDDGGIVDLRKASGAPIAQIEA